MNLLHDSPFQSVEHTVIWVLIGFSVITWGLALLKLIQFGRLRALDRSFNKRFWSASNLPDAIELGDQHNGATARVAQAGFKAIQIGDGQDLAQAIAHQDRLERALRQQIQRERRSLESGLAVLASIGSTSPFIGLFGTVWGIMNSFISISESQTTNLAIVAPGIAEALLATAIGLVAAIPAVIIYNIFARSVTSYRHLLADVGAGVERLVSRDLDIRAAREIVQKQAARVNPAQSAPVAKAAE